jgi:hypothetical protein
MAELRPGIRARELAVTVWLHERGLAVVPPADELPVQVHEHDGHAITFWRLLPDDEPDAVAAGTRLRELDEALRGYDGELPGFWPVYESRALANRLELPAIVHEVIDRADAGLVDAPLVPVHGDPHRRNCYAGPLWGDLEDACLAPREWEHACLQLPVHLDGDRWHADALAQLAAPDPERLALCTLLRAAMAVTWGTYVDGTSARISERVAWLRHAASSATP